MKLIVAAALFMPLLLIPAKAHVQKPNKVPFSLIQGYRPRANAFPGPGFNTQLFARKDQFELNFEKVPGAAAVSKLDFAKFVVLACYGDKTTIETTLSLEKIEKQNGIMKVYFKKVAGGKRTTPIAPCCLYTTGIDRSLNGIDYYINGKLQEEIRN